MEKQEYEHFRREILPYMDGQQNTQIRDSSGNRWIECEICGGIDIDMQFCMYGGIGKVNKGICNKCKGEIGKLLK